ncbi:MAG: Tex-like N-terminal domain-containing protein [Candidatus Cloacimonadales bacterium]
MYNKIAGTTNLRAAQVETVINLTKEGYTIPFISRYRKEQTNNLDEIGVKLILDEFEKIEKLNARRAEIIATLTEREQLTPKLQLLLEKAEKLSNLEEIYKPYKKKQKTKAMVARENGLEDVAIGICHFKETRPTDFKKYIGKNYATQEEVIADALHIVIDDIVNNQYLRTALKDMYLQRGQLIVVKTKDEELDQEKTYSNYYEFKKPLKYLEAFQVLAINRGEKEKVLSSTIDVDIDVQYKMERILRFGDELGYYEELTQAVKKAYSAGLKPSLSREIMSDLTDDAEKRSIEVFSSNLRALMLKKPYRANSVMGIDPGFRTGCKVAVVDEYGQFLAQSVIYPVPPHNKIRETEKIVSELIKKYDVSVIAIGDGTASYETSVVIADIIQKYKLETNFTIVSESGASVYSASEIAQEEFPDLDLTIRSAISIARRVLSFLDELIKIPPESIGVGMYQHDINAKKLKESLEFEVSSVVHHVGVELNTSSPYLLQYVSGISKNVAKNIVQYRAESGGFTNRKDLLKVKGFGPKAFELASGFCRVSSSVHPLDNTIIHPDDYPKVVSLLASMGIKKRIQGFSYQELKELFSRYKREELTSTELSQYDIDFIYSAIVERDIDPRESLPTVQLSNQVYTIEDFTEYSEWQGEVKNVTDFGLFVSLGIKTDGLLHVSNFASKKEMFANYFPGKIIDVIIKSVDKERNRIQLLLAKK